MREVPGGLFSGWLVHEVAARRRDRGAAAAGRVHRRTSARPGRHVLIAAGSGITRCCRSPRRCWPATRTPRSRCCTATGAADSVMFADELADLKDRYPAPGSQLVHVLSREPQEVELFTGRLDAAGCGRCSPRWSTSTASTTGGCAGRSAWSPTPSEVLAELGVPPERVHRELFYVDDAAARAHRPTRRRRRRRPSSEVTVVLDGRPPRSTLPRGHAGPRRRAAVAARPAVRLQGRRLRHLPGPASSTARSTMRRNFALDQAEVAAGFVLTCQSLPVSDAVTVDYDG